MIEEVRLPEISENVDSGDVIAVLVKAGDFVEKEQSIAELETEKAAFEVPCPVKGRVVEVSIKEGDKVKVNQLILKVETEPKTEEQTQVRQEPHCSNKSSRRLSRKLRSLRRQSKPKSVRLLRQKAALCLIFPSG